MTNQEKNSKQQQLDQFRVNDQDQALTTNQGLKMAEDEFSLKAGERGPTLIEDFHFREKMTHFDHERIPERIVHARGEGAHGEFELYESLEAYTKAEFLTDTSKKTPVFVRFSTVAGSRGSADLARDARGFATKFYTEQGNYDLVGNNIPVFFIQDAIKFPDLVHSVKPEPHNEIPQAASAHDTFWDFVANNQESAHMVMWTMSDRAIPRSLRMMEGFGVHTFRLINKEGTSHFVKFHWKPVLGTHSVVWDEAQKVNGKNPDFHREDLWQAIEDGNFPEWELGLQIISEEDEFKFDFDILDPTKLWPEEDVPVKLVGKMTLNRNPDNFFAETEQVAFHPGHLVPGIDFTNDPLLQGRLFSYTDTQLIRLGGPNFHELPINRPVCPFFNNQRDGYGRQTINVGRVSYHKNSLANNTPRTTLEEEGGFSHYQEKIDARKVRARSESFKDHFSQATMFFNSMSEVEKKHLIDAMSFELGKCKEPSIREQVVEMFSHVHIDLAKPVAESLGMEAPTEKGPYSEKSSPALSQMNTVMKPDTRKVAILTSVHASGDVQAVVDSLKSAGLQVEVIAERQGKLDGGLEIDQKFLTADSVLYDAVVAVAGPEASTIYKKEASNFMREAFDHVKPLGAAGEGKQLLEHLGFTGEPGVTEDVLAASFVDEVAKHRFWERELGGKSNNKH